MIRLIRACLLALPLILGTASLAAAGPPFLTDDPEPVDYQHYEFYVFSTFDKAEDGTTVQGPAIEYNIGALPNVQLHMVIPYVWNAQSGGPTVSGLGDTELGVKFRFVRQTSSMPEIGVFPMVESSTGNSANGLGNGRSWYRLPLWIQKDSGPWTTYGGGGYAINSAPGMKNYAFGGWLLQREIGDHLTLGTEIFMNGPAAVGAEHATYYNVGGYFKPNDRFNVLFSIGHTISGERHAIGYLGLYWTGGPERAELAPKS